MRTSSTQRFELMLCTEFNEPSCKLSGDAVRAEIRRPGSSDDVGTSIPLRCIGHRGEVGIFEFELPSVAGSYQLYLRVSQECIEGKLVDQYMLLSVLSDTFTVFEGDGHGTTPTRLLRVFRQSSPASLPSIVVSEDYGVTLGSHIYDCALVLVGYLKMAFGPKPTSSKAPKRSALELGSGCGLVGIWLAHYFDRVYLTDVPSQMTLLRENVRMNSCITQKCHCLSLDWNDDHLCSSESNTTPSLDPLRRSIGVCGPREEEENDDPPLQLIIAADVFYDRDATVALFRLVEAIVNKSLTAGDGSRDIRILMAQKLRSDSLTFDIQSLVSESVFSIREVLVAHEVRILEFVRQ
jgi:hypothetical protein